MPESTDAKITPSYEDIVTNPQTYIANSYPLSEVDWNIINSTNVSSAIFGAGISAIIPIAVPGFQYMTEKPVDKTLIYEAFVGLAIIGLNYLCKSRFDRKRIRVYRRIEKHFSKFGVGAQI